MDLMGAILMLQRSNMHGSNTESINGLMLQNVKACTRKGADTYNNGLLVPHTMCSQALTCSKAT